MIRALLAFVAVLVVVLAFVFNRPWLYGAAAASLVGVLGVLAQHFWEAYQSREVADVEADSSEEDSLEDLGIMNVRPQEDEATGERDGAEETATSEDEEQASPSAAASEKGRSTSDEWPKNTLSEEERTTMAGRDAAAPAAYSEDRPVLGPFLESLRAAMGAQTACLLVQEEVALEYRIEALASVQPSVQVTGVFETQEPLLSATMSRQPVTVCTVDDTARQDLRYYDTVPAVTQRALAPVARPDTSATVFLMVDATAEVDLGASSARSLLEQFAESVPLLLDLEGPIRSAPATDEIESDPGPEGEVGTDGAASPDPDTDPAAPRPRREIIAEEMDAADAASDALALVLVHLNRAESIARRGEEAVASAEQHLRSRLEDLAPGVRVERFGELTYGLFVRSAVDEVEEWAADLQEAMAHETGTLEGGVSVGVAVRHEHHDPEGLRADATDALLEAYETGTTTIIA